MITAKVVADSKNEFGNRITTMVVTFPRIILAEFNTHRMFSRNSASSRAIPFEKMLKSVEENPFVPIAWQKDHKGMQGTEYFTAPKIIEEIEGHWWDTSREAIENAKKLSEKGVTKQLCNRLLEPFMWHTVIITATDFENFFYLRCPKYTSIDTEGNNVGKTFRSRKDWKKAHPGADVDAFGTIEWLQLNAGQAEIHAMGLAEAMYDAYQESMPRNLKAGEWHMPFAPKYEHPEIAKALGIELDHQSDVGIVNAACIKIATANCARVSYTVVGEEGKEPNYENDIKLHDRLAASGHWSPFEHCARAMDIEEYNSKVSLSDGTGPSHMISNEGMSGNFCGFIQYRKLFRNENVTK